MRIAIVGSGISGLGCAHALTSMGHAVVVYEKDKRLGGHSNTVQLKVDGQTFGVDTGFLVYNDRTYPRLLALFEEFDVESALSDMSFAVRNDVSGLEWAGTNLSTLFIDKRNLFRLRFLRMVRDILRFNAQVTTLAQSQAPITQTLGAFLNEHRYGESFVDDYLLPMAACIWSAPKAQILAFPLHTFAHFFHNHGLLAISNRPQWRTVRGGSKRYVEKVAAALSDVRVNDAVHRVNRDNLGVEVVSANGVERFDRIVFACHSNEALSLLAAPSASEAQALGAVKYQPNTAVLHTDASLMPRRRGAWSAWNYLVLDTNGVKNHSKVSLTYWMNALQPLPCKTDIFVTLNPASSPAAEKTFATFEYAHPLFDAAAIEAQHTIERIQGQNKTFFAGAWLGYGFHEDGLRSGQEAAAKIGALA